MTSAIRAVDRMRPLIVVSALGLHAVAAFAMPDFVASVTRIVDDSAWVQVDALAPEQETVVPEVVPEPEPDRVRPIDRAEPVAQTEAPVAQTEPEPVVAEVPTPTPTEEPAVAAAPSDPLTAPGGQVAIATTGRVGSESGNGTATTSSGTTNAAPTIDRRALLRSYRSAVSPLLRRLPPLRGTREQIDAAVVVGMHIAADGRISDVRVVRSSGHDVVDTHVAEYFRGLGRLPVPPPELDLRGTEFTVIVRVGT